MKLKSFQMDFSHKKWIKHNSTQLLAIFILLIFANIAQATVLSTFVASYKNTGTTWTSNDQYDQASVEVYVDPTKTNWIGWNNATTINYQVSSRPGELFWGPGNYGTDDYIWLTVTDPNNNSLNVKIDYNDAWGVSFGTQNVIYGEAASTPDSYRIAPGGSNAIIFDESGSHNSLFNIAGNYTFDFAFYNNTGPANHSTIYLLQDVTTTPGIPEPGTFLLFGIGMLALWRKR